MSSFSRFQLFILMVQVTWLFIASEGSEIQDSVGDFRPINLNLHQIYATCTNSLYSWHVGRSFFNTQIPKGIVHRKLPKAEISPKRHKTISIIES